MSPNLLICPKNNNSRDWYAINLAERSVKNLTKQVFHTSENFFVFFMHSMVSKFIADNIGCLSG